MYQHLAKNRDRHGETKENKHLQALTKIEKTLLWQGGVHPCINLFFIIQLFILGLILSNSCKGETSQLP